MIDAELHEVPDFPFWLQGDVTGAQQASYNINVTEFISNMLPLLEMEKDVEVAQVC